MLSFASPRPMAYPDPLPITLDDRTNFDSGLIIRDVAVCLFTVLLRFSVRRLSRLNSYPPFLLLNHHCFLHHTCVHPPIYLNKLSCRLLTHTLYILHPTPYSQLTFHFSTLHSRSHPPHILCPKYSHPTIERSVIYPFIPRVCRRAFFLLRFLAILLFSTFHFPHIPFA